MPRGVHGDSENEWPDNAAKSDEERSGAGAFKLAGTNEQTECAVGGMGAKARGLGGGCVGCIILVSSHYEERSSGARGPRRMGSLSFN
jgi:hypothetical protein